MLYILLHTNSNTVTFFHVHDNASTAKSISSVGTAHFVSQNETTVQFKVLRTTNILPPNLSVNFCNGLISITITPASGQSSTIYQVWDKTCESDRVLVNISADSFPDPMAGVNYTVTFNIIFYFDGIADPCYLKLEVDNISVGKLKV